MGISACIIAKNEEDTIKRCLDSLKDAVDEIILVDTGSEDNTIEIAKSYGAKIYHHPWNQDFSEVRNVSLEKAKEEWLLIIDCDEELTKNSIPLLKELTKDSNTTYDSIGIKLSNIIAGDTGYTDTIIRVIKNNPQYRFHGAIYEKISDTILKVRGLEGIKLSEIQIDHYGFDTKEILKKKKIERNISILKSLPKNTRDGLYYLNLGNEYLRLNNTRRALSYYKQAFKIAPENSTYFIDLCYRLMETLYNSEDYICAVSYGEYILKVLPEFRVIHFFKAICHIKLKQYKEALVHLNIYTDQEEQLLSKYPNLYYGTIENINDLKSKIEDLLGL